MDDKDRMTNPEHEMPDPNAHMHSAKEAAEAFTDGGQNGGGTSSETAASTSGSNVNSESNGGNGSRSDAGTRARAKEAVAGASSAFKEKAAAAKQKIGGETQSMKVQASEKAKAAANEGKAKASAAILSFSKLIEDNAGTVDQNVGTTYGDYLRTAAQTVASVADSIDQKDVEEFLDDTRTFVKKNPAIAIGAAAVLGFALVRIAKSGASYQEEETA